MSVISHIRSTGLWPEAGGLGEQDSGLVFWFLLVDGITEEEKQNQYERELRRMESDRW